MSENETKAKRLVLRALESSAGPLTLDELVARPPCRGGWNGRPGLRSPAHAAGLRRRDPAPTDEQAAVNVAVRAGVGGRPAAMGRAR